MKILLIDNYDSFTYNLVHYLECFNVEVDVVFNDKIPFNNIKNYNKVVLSPGPGLPLQSGDLLKFISKFHTQIPMLGVCLGFQALVEFFGGEIYNQQEVKHGVTETCFFNTKSKLFSKTANQFNIGLYHSWAANPKQFPNCLNITAKTKQNTIMAFEHNTLPICGVQFHPESIMTENGKQIINNFLLNF